MIAIIKKQHQQTKELKSMISEGLNILGRAMSMAEEMCHDTAPEEFMGERRGGRMGMREADYDPMMGERGYPSYPMDSTYGDRRNPRGRYGGY